MTENPVSIGNPRTKSPGATPSHRISGALETGFETGFLSGDAMSFREWQSPSAHRGVALDHAQRFPTGICRAE
jgi:hypothetical protein